MIAVIIFISAYFIIALALLYTAWQAPLFGIPALLIWIAIGRAFDKSTEYRPDDLLWPADRDEEKET